MVTRGIAVTVVALAACTPPPVVDAGAVGEVDSGPARRPGATELVVVDTERIEGPTWQPVDFHLVPVTVGTAEEGYAASTDEIGAALDPNHLWSADDGFWVPGAPHDGPYQAELQSAVGEKSQTTFTIDQFTPPAGIVATFTLVPLDNSVRGSSPDTVNDPPDAGPGVIIDGAVFPITIGGELTQGETIFDETFFHQIEQPSLLSTPISVDGPSHVVLAFPMSMEMAPEGTPIPGTYALSLILRDVNEFGWTVTLRFTVGTPCDCDDDCAGGSCTPTSAGVSVCSPSCNSSDAFCPDGQTCVLSGTKVDDVVHGVCQTSRVVLHAPGSVCAGNSECESNLCIAVPAAGRSVCKNYCESDDDCPALYSCVDDACLLSTVGTPCPAPAPTETPVCGASRGGAALAPLVVALLGIRRRRRV